MIINPKEAINLEMLHFLNLSILKNFQQLVRYFLINFIFIFLIPPHDIYVKSAVAFNVLWSVIAIVISMAIKKFFEKNPNIFFFFKY